MPAACVASNLCDGMGDSSETAGQQFLARDSAGQTGKVHGARHQLVGAGRGEILGNTLARR